MCDKYKFIVWAVATAILSAVTTANPCRANVSADIQSALQARESNLSKTTFVWHLSASQSKPSPDPKAVAQDQKSVAMQAEKRARRMGTTDEDQIRRFVQRETNLVAAIEAGYSFNFTDHRRFANNDKVTEVIGRNQFAPTTASAYYERYDSNYGLTAPIDLKQPSSSARSQIWASTDNSTQFPNPFPDSLNLRPEDFVLLAGKNPIKVYAAEWQTISRSQKSVVLQSKQLKGVPGNSTILIVLDPKHGYVPLSIQSAGSTWAVRYDVQGYQLYKGNWLPRQVVVDGHILNIHSHKVFVFDSASNSSPKLKSLPHMFVADYRLVGNNPYVGQIDDAQSGRGQSIVSYTWKSKIPSISELRKISQQQYPGEGEPDPSRSTAVPPGLTTPAARASLVNSVLPFTGGLVCIASGVWMFQHRRTK